MNWILNFLRSLWPRRRAPEQRPSTPDTSLPEPTAPESAGPEPFEPEPPEPEPAPPSPTLVDGMPPLPPDIDPPLLLEDSARIGPAPAIVRPGVDDATAEPASDAVEARRPEDEAEEQPDAEEEDEEEEQYDDEDPLEPDPFISTDGPVIEALSQSDIARLRAEARDLALGGDHRILLSDIAGPGTLAEALNRLLREGKVTAEFHDPEGEEPYIRYTPLPDSRPDTAPPADPAPSGRWEP